MSQPIKIKTVTMLAIFLVTSLFLSACEKKQDVTKEKAKVEVKVEAPKEVVKVEKEHAHDHHHGHEETATPKLKLDGDKKWKANIETTQGVTKLSTISEAGMQMEKPSKEEIQKKAEELHTTFQNIFKECTMKGESHDQLHQLLVPVGAMLKKIKASDSASAAANFKELHEHLKVYPTYFE